MLIPRNTYKTSDCYFWARFEGKIFVGVGRSFNSYLVTAATFSVSTRLLSSGVEWPGRDDDDLFASSCAEFKNESSCTSIFPYVVMV
jgi:hypothetical protein